MEVMEAICSRRSIRAFKPDPVPREVLEDLLRACRWAPSARNTQPWDLVVLGGKVMDKVKICLTNKIKAKTEPSADIPVPELPEPYSRRAIEQRDRVDMAQFPLGTEGLSKKRAAYWITGGCFHDAPNGIIICLERALYPKMLFDVGIMAQTICLAAITYGLGTCITLRPVYWPSMLRELLGISETKLLVMAIAIGYPMPEARINNFIRLREPLESFVHWCGV